MKRRTYIAINLKSFYASVECRERGLDPLDTAASEGSECRTAARRPGWRTTWSTAPASIRFISSILPRKILWSTPSTRCSYPIAYLHEKRDKTRTVPFLQEQLHIVSGTCVHFIRMNQPTAKSRCFIPLFMGCSNKYLRIRLRCFLRSMVRWLTISALKSLLTSMRICSDIREQCTYTIKGCQ